MVMSEIVILGAGGFGRQAAWLASRIPGMVVTAILDETTPNTARSDNGVPVLRDLHRFSELDRSYRPALVSAVGDLSVRLRWAQIYGDDFEFMSLIDPRATIAPTAAVGVGSMFLPGAICSSETKVGSHVIFGFDSIASHEVSVGAFTHIASGAILNGGASIGKNCAVGAGAVVLPNVTVGDGARIGAGAIVAKDVPPGKTLLGHRARAPLARS